MQNRIGDTTEEWGRQTDNPQPIGDILEKLMAQYERQFPGVRMGVSGTATTAV
jgi:hypothetical protein